MEALSILDKENGILVSYSPAGICIILEKRRFAIMENDALVAKEDEIFTFHDAEKFATELTNI
jgi:hypothetical protein